MFGFANAVFIGVFLGFGFGVGCALAVMYGLFMGGYRAAIREGRMPVPPERYVKALKKVEHTVDRVTNR
jgi:hypothetical protein